ncbi:rod shape-determining protein MreD [Lentibacillus sediminis]|uniref:rod shape-determining protein MreD n=1 Tax=Lentibacillus sediminis TaxID=1940529 RepID=UPI000C1C70BE|nr:rod shape-determining protein MreD [Lentibacillus sediminis]
MKRIYLPLILFLLLLLEGVALKLLPPGLVISDLLITPHWVLVFLILVSIFYDREDTYYSVLYALLFGLLFDIVYTGILGVYMFSYALVVYIVHGLRRMLHGNIFASLLLGAVGIVIADIFIYMVYTVVGMTEVVWADYLMTRLLPSLLANWLFLVIIYPLTVNKLTDWGEEQLTGSKSIL